VLSNEEGVTEEIRPDFARLLPGARSHDEKGYLCGKILGDLGADGQNRKPGATRNL
jgi:hypothetical protein